MKIYTVTKFRYLNFSYAQTGIEVLANENIYVSNNDYSYFLEKYSNLATVTYEEDGENLYKYNPLQNPKVFFNNGVYKDTVTNKYYIITSIE